MPTQRMPVKIDLAVLEALYGMPQPAAARALGIALTTLKQVCRKLGIKRWPYARELLFHTECATSQTSVQRARSQPACLDEDEGEHSHSRMQMSPNSLDLLSWQSPSSYMEMEALPQLPPPPPLMDADLPRQSALSQSTSLQTRQGASVQDIQDDSAPDRWQHGFEPTLGDPFDNSSLNKVVFINGFAVPPTSWFREDSDLEEVSRFSFNWLSPGVLGTNEPDKDTAWGVLLPAESTGM